MAERHFVCERCGAKFQRDTAWDEIPNCPKCGAGGAGSNAGAAKADAERLQQKYGLKKCPECGSVLAARDIVCVKCSYDFQAGRKLVTVSPPSREESLRQSLGLIQATFAVLFKGAVVAALVVVAAVGAAYLWRTIGQQMAPAATNLVVRTVVTTNVVMPAAQRNPIGGNAIATGLTNTPQSNNRFQKVKVRLSSPRMIGIMGETD